MEETELDMGSHTVGIRRGTFPVVLSFGCFVFLANTESCPRHYLKKVGVTIDADLCENRTFEKPVPEWMCAKECNKDEKVYYFFL